MHSQKKFGDRTRFDGDRCALATATSLQHPERLAEARSVLISFWPPAGRGLKGLVSRRRDRLYQAGRSKHWIKMKNRAHPAMHFVGSREPQLYTRGTDSHPGSGYDPFTGR